MIVGIDLGTTNSAVAYLTTEGPRMIPNAIGDPLTPSVVGVDEKGEILVGQAARDLQVTHPERCAAAFKRQMGIDWQKELGGRPFTPETLSSLVLRSLKQDAEAYLKQPVEESVITVPAYFNEHQRKATMRAGQIAGLTVNRILNEPTAAAIAYGFHEAKEDKTILVVDLGGGTFDVSVVEMFEGMVEVRASSGDSFLGGEDFTAALAVRLLATQGLVFERAEMERPLLVARLQHLCESAKRRLSYEPSVTVRVPNLKGELVEGGAEIDVSREQFEAWTERILARIETPMRRAVSDGGLNYATLDEVILVGGATRMPCVIARLRDITGHAPQLRIDPDHVVALGAAVQAGLIANSSALGDLVVTDVAPFTLGIEVSKQLAGELRPGYMMPIIHRNTTIPISRMHRIQTVLPNQTAMRIAVYQGENRHVKNNVQLGEFTLDGIPAGPPGQEVDIRFTYDLNGVLEVDAMVVQTQRRLTHVIARHARGMSRDEIRKAVAEMQSLKTHPRDEAVNQSLLKRGERLYGELSLSAQQFLGQLLDGFEQALELGERTAIERYQQALTDFFDEHDQTFNSGDPTSP
jgi:molecular chaperone HscC